jgi:hypothetical protein
LADLLFFSWGGWNGTQGFACAKQPLYHWTASQNLADSMLMHFLVVTYSMVLIMNCLQWLLGHLWVPVLSTLWPWTHGSHYEFFSTMHCVDPHRVQ